MGENSHQQINKQAVFSLNQSINPTSSKLVKVSQQHSQYELSFLRGRQGEGLQKTPTGDLSWALFPIFFTLIGEENNS